MEKKQLKEAALRIKALQYQIVTVSTELAVKGRDKKELQDDHDKLDIVIKTFNEFAVSVMVAIAEIEGNEGEHTTLYPLYSKKICVCLLLGG